ncbi:MAG: molybdopterin-guanine dinucleotide biosynthesis protein B [Coriobacteriia bacterium]|nr:molybdopterin-guanine dinucleotide biosynthesis protein B [Coriobacteriia bacterium]
MVPPVTTIKGVSVISIVAWSNSGKTTLFEKVVSRLHKQNIKVGVIKHHSHDTDIDVKGKDSWRYSQAGASPVVISSPTQFSVIRQRPEKEATLVELCEEIADEVDLIITEGYKYEAMSKIEFSRVAHNPKPVEEGEQLIALISDNDERKRAYEKEGIPCFDLDDVDGVSNFLLQFARH